MEEVFGSIAGYFNMELVLDTQHAFSESFTANFNNQSLEEIMEMVKLSTQQEFKAEEKNDKLIISN